MANDNKTTFNLNTEYIEPYVRPQRNSAPFQYSPISHNDSPKGGGKRSSSQSPTVPRIQIDPNKPPPPPPRRNRVVTISSSSGEFVEMSDHLSSPKYSNNTSANTSPSSSKINSPAITPPSSPGREYTINNHCNTNESLPPPVAPRKSSANEETPDDSHSHTQAASPSSFLRTQPKRGLRGIAISPTSGKPRPLPPIGPLQGVNNGRLSILGAQREHGLLGVNTPGQTPPISPSTSPPTSPREHGMKRNGSAGDLPSLTSSGESSPSPSVTRKDRVNLSHFKLIKLIGKGGFGEVYLVEHIKSGKKLALKVMDKRDISKKDKVQSIKNERNVLVKGKLHNAWLVRLHYSFQDKAFLYLAMEYCPGGDLRAFLSAHGDLEEEDARLYFAEMILSVYTLHQMGYIHRDLKPDNFLIDKNGHLKLADFGLSKEAVVRRTQLDTMRSTPLTRSERRGSILNVPKQLETLSASNFDQRFQRTRRESTNKKVVPKPQTNGRAYSIVGSPDYMSPEVLTQEGYGEEVDWWSLGVIFFEMILGIPPFGGDTPEEVFEAIGNYKQLLPSILAQYRPYMTNECFALIGGLLCDPKNRLGDQEGIERFKKLKFFDGLDWDNLLEHEPPFKPILDDDLDTKYFHVEDPGQAFSDGEVDG